MNEEQQTKEGSYTVSNSQPIVPRVYICLEEKELLVKILDRIIDEK